MPWRHHRLMRRVSALVLAALVGSAAGCASAGSDSAAPWTLIQSDRDASSVIVAYFHGSCDSLRSVHTVSTATTVSFRIQIHEDAGTCDAAGRTTPIRVRLGGKLGTRDVVGACREASGVLCVSAAALKAAKLDLHKLPVYGP
jgi:hypothetical protein